MPDRMAAGSNRSAAACYTLCEGTLDAFVQLFPAGGDALPKTVLICERRNHASEVGADDPAISIGAGKVEPLLSRLAFKDSFGYGAHLFHAEWMLPCRAAK